MIRARSILWMLLSGILALATQPSLRACAACFGKSDSNLAKGMNMGIFVLLLVITSVLCGVAGFFVYLAKRGNDLGDSDAARTLSTNQTNA